MPFRHIIFPQSEPHKLSYLYRSDIGVLSNVLVLI